MPIHRLDEEPTRRGTLQDITCDSDGVIDRFAGGRKGKPCLELHPWPDGEPYILGIFLTGAYQEILGDLHNLFGDTNAVHIGLTNGATRSPTWCTATRSPRCSTTCSSTAIDLLADLPPQGRQREGPVPHRGQRVHRRLRGRAGGVHLPRRRRPGGIALGRPGRAEGRGSHAIPAPLAFPVARLLALGDRHEGPGVRAGVDLPRPGDLLVLVDAASLPTAPASPAAGPGRRAP